MNLYKIWVTKYDYDEYNAWIVAAENEEAIFAEERKVKYGLQLPMSVYTYDLSKGWDTKPTKVERQELHIRKIGETDLYNEFTYILGSFNAG